MELGAYDYIMKPVDLNLLMTKIEDAFQAKNVPSQGGGSGSAG
jgi:DNA-binding NtrC family response regulator